MNDSKVIVIGGGIVGGWSAMEIQQRGHQVCWVERDTVGSGASSGNCGYVCPSHVMPLHGPGVIAATMAQVIRPGSALSVPPRWDPQLWKWMLRFARHCNAASQSSAAVARHALLQSSKEIYGQFAIEHGSDLHWRNDGLLLVFAHQKSFDQYGLVVERLRSEFDLSIDSLDATAVSNQATRLRDGLAGGWWFPGDAHLRPGNLLRCIRDRFIEAGGELIEQTTIDQIVLDRDRVTGLQTTDGRRLAADQFVLATGAESPRLAKQLGCQLSIIPGKGYSLSVATEDFHPTVPMIFEDSHVAVTPMDDEFRIGSTMQLTGYDRSVAPKRLELLWRSTENHVRDFRRTPTTRTWSGWRPMSSDGLPYIGRPANAKNLVVAAGNGMIGIASGSGTGHLVADLITGQSPTIDPEPYRIDRH